MIFDTIFLIYTALIFYNLWLWLRYDVTAWFLVIFLLARVYETAIIVFILLIFLDDLIIDCRKYHLLFVLRFFVQVFLNLSEPFLTFYGASKAIQSPLLSILLENQQDQYYQVSIQVVKVAMALLRAMINAYPKEIKCNIVKEVQNFRVITFFIESFPDII